MRAVWRVGFCLLVLLCLWPVPPAAAQFEDELAVRVNFQTSPSGAHVLRLGLKTQDLGLSGEPVLVDFPKDRDITMSFLLQLEGYNDFQVDVSSADLRGSGSEVIQFPYDRAIPLTAKSPWTAFVHYVKANKVAMGVGTAVALAALFIFVLPKRRAVMRKARRLKELIHVKDSLSDDNVGGAIGRWILVRLLGRGGCAAVYEGVPLETLDSKEAVAIKIMHGAALNQEFKDRFAREVNICKSLNHPNLVRLLDWEQGKHFYLVMELVEGKSLRGMVPPHGMTLPETLDIMEGVFSAIGYAHQKGVVHCDMKPENIMITTDGRVRVMDFGIATGRDYQRLTTTTNVLGTPGYIAPEQMDGVRDDGRSDQYAIGVILFEMLTGRQLFEAADPILRLTMHLTQAPPKVHDLNPAIPESVSEVVDRMLAKDPHDRFATMQDAWWALASAGGQAFRESRARA